MLVTIYPGARRPDVLETLRGIHSKIGDAVNVHGSAVARAIAYLDWANDSVRMLEHRVSAADINRLVLTPGYERLLSATGILTAIDTGTQGVLSGLVRREIDRQGELLAEAVKDLQDQILRWPPDSLYAVADTSFYIEHEDKLEGIDFAPLLDSAWLDKRVTLIVPVIILDELDGLKHRGPTPHAKWRASYTLGVFDRIFAKPDSQGILRQPAADRTRGGVLANLLFDPPQHERLPIPDDEIIDRTLAAQGLTGTEVTLLTFDTSQAARARHAGLAVNKLARPLGEEPENTRRKNTSAASY
jgi:PIN domain